MSQLDIQGNRAGRKHTCRYIVRRGLWECGRVLFRLTPVPLFKLRSVILRCHGARIGRDVRIHPAAVISYPWNLEIGDFAALGEGVFVDNHGLVKIGQRATISQCAHLCSGTHDYTDKTMPLLMPPITIGQDAWICAGVFVGPDVTIGDGAVVGARAVVVNDIAPWMVAVGHPAKAIKPRVLQDAPQ
ncbi:putative colanic acid biosynthesis acetyltransferase [Cerasicoccus arenae]|uniref:putative colanic acid biosynthesis acetyltransferase n=1 Tax=Cerasicoccus arenae TaxID=424488 RepID=UPI00167AA17B|nr:putative colanic acid biosynthesis acetyltransferase [Cerasicoccus arenae]MBK1858667.1 hypothetical protein [Cerasicoccus arenae]